MLRKVMAATRRSWPGGGFFTECMVLYYPTQSPLDTAVSMKYQEIQRQYLQKRQDEIWKTVRSLTRRTRSPVGYRPRIDPTQRVHPRDVRTEPAR